MVDQNSFLFETFLYIILVVKILFVIFMLLAFHAKRKNFTDKYETYESLEELFHTLFTFLMGILLLVLFHPIGSWGKEVCVSGETKTFLYIFGFLSIGSVIQKAVQTRQEIYN